MDMRATEVLAPKDTFRFVVFGGILGDHPPQDRAMEFRSRFNHIRQLGDVQMTTDTAVLVSHEILEGKTEISNLNFVDEPCIPMDDQVTRYLDEMLPLAQMAEGVDLSKVHEYVGQFKEAC